jgi:hypothetical protein
MIDKQEDVLEEGAVRVEELRVSGDDLLAKVRELLREGNVRRVAIKDQEGRTRFDISLPIAMAGALVKPKLVALAAIAAVLTHGSIVVERVEDQLQVS